MNGYNFTEGVRRVLALAREEAARLRHEYVGTEHILLGLTYDTDGGAAAIFKQFDLDPQKLRALVEAVVQKGAAVEPTGPDLPYTTRAKKILEFAMLEARDLQHSYVGTEHLLLGLLREEKGLGAQTLSESGLKLEAVRAGVVQWIGASFGSQGGMKAGFSLLGRDDDSMKRSARTVSLWYLARNTFLSSAALALVFLIVDVLMPPAISPEKSLVMAVIGGLTVAAGSWMWDLQAPRRR